MKHYGQSWFISKEAMDELNANIKNIGAVSSSLFSNTSHIDTIKKYGSVAVIEISGVLSSKVSEIEKYFGYYDYNDLIENIKLCIEDNSVNSIVLDFDSPGGLSSPMFETAKIIHNLKKIKPIYSFVSNLCCSAAYGLASATDKIFVTEAAEIGSIGTMISISKQTTEDQNGYKIIDIVSDDSPLKNPDPTTEAGIASYKKRVNSLTQLFFTMLADNRNVSVDFIKNNFGGGEVFTGADAKVRQMADEITTFDNLLTHLNNIHKGGLNMNEPTNIVKDDKQQMASVDINQIKQDVLNEERARIKAISNICVAGKTDASILANAIDKGITADELSVEIIKSKATVDFIDGDKNIVNENKIESQSKAYVDFIKNKNN